MLAAGVLLGGVCAPALASLKPFAAGRSTSARARAQVIDDWDTFFSGPTPVSRKVALLQNGDDYAKVVAAQANSPIVKGVAAEVSKVTLTSATSATVTYSLTIGGKPVLASLKGEAVLQNGTWKVGDQSFCALLSLEQVKVPRCPSSRGDS